MNRRDENQSAYRRLKAEIDRQYSAGRFIAIDGGRVIADADSFVALESSLTQLGLNSPDVLVVEAAAEYPTFATILM